MTIVWLPKLGLEIFDLILGKIFDFFYISISNTTFDSHLVLVQKNLKISAKEFISTDNLIRSELHQMQIKHTVKKLTC